MDPARRWSSPKVRRKTKPTRASRERRLETKTRTARTGRAAGPGGELTTLSAQRKSPAAAFTRCGRCAETHRCRETGAPVAAAGKNFLPEAESALDREAARLRRRTRRSSVRRAAVRAASGMSVTLAVTVSSGQVAATAARLPGRLASRAQPQVPSRTHPAPSSGPASPAGSSCRCMEPPRACCRTAASADRRSLEVETVAGKVQHVLVRLCRRSRN